MERQKKIVGHLTLKQIATGKTENPKEMTKLNGRMERGNIMYQNDNQRRLLYLFMVVHFVSSLFHALRITFNLKTKKNNNIFDYTNRCRKAACRMWTVSRQQKL